MLPDHFHHKHAPGTKLWLDGPYGVFTLDREQGPRFVLLGGGVGITPLYSMCATLAGREDMRPVVLFYGCWKSEELTFREELNRLSGRMNLKIVYVLEEAFEGWQGETGLIDAPLLRRHPELEIPGEQVLAAACALFAGIVR